MERRGIEQKQIKEIWAAARENGIDKQSIYDIIYAVSEKDSMREITYLEAAKVIGRIRGKAIAEDISKTGKRTDEGGDPQTVRLRRKIYMLTEQLGWNNDNNRINGFVKKMFGVERLEWLSPKQCHTLIETLKQMLRREEQAR